MTQTESSSLTLSSTHTCAVFNLLPQNSGNCSHEPAAGGVRSPAGGHFRWVSSCFPQTGKCILTWLHLHCEKESGLVLKLYRLYYTYTFSTCRRTWRCKINADCSSVCVCVREDLFDCNNPPLTESLSGSLFSHINLWIKHIIYFKYTSNESELLQTSLHVCILFYIMFMFTH